MVRVLVVDDHPVVREGLVAVLADQADLDVVGAAGSAEDALELVQRLRPDVVLLDVRLPDTDGFTVAAELTGRAGGPAVVVTSSSDDPRYPELARRSGARGFLSKHDLGGPSLRLLLA